MAKKRHAGHRPFKSRAQARLFFANPKLRRWAKKKEDATDRVGGIKSLPERVGAPGARTARGGPARAHHARVGGRSRHRG